MTVERMLEIIILQNILKDVNHSAHYTTIDNLNICLMCNRFETLIKEFLEPYVVVNAEKSE